MASIKVIAQDIMDAYYQEPYVDDNETPFDIGYFIRTCIDEYTSLLDKEFMALYANHRADGMSRMQNLSLDNGWLFYEQVTLKADDKRKDFYAELKYPILSFSYDQSNLGLQDAQPIGGRGCDLVRDRGNTAWMNKLLPKTNTVFYFPEGRKTVRFTSNCCKEVLVGYVPSGSPDLGIKDGKAADIKRGVLQLMFAAKQGMPVTNQTNDSNVNTIPQTELNKETLK